MANSVSLFMQIDGVKGSVTDKQYQDWVALECATIGGHNPAVLDGGSGQLTSSNVYFHELSFSKTMDATSTQLISMMADGTRAEKVIIAQCVKSNGKKYEICRWIYEDCFFSGYDTHLQDNDNIPQENISMAYAKVTVEANTISSKGATTKHGPVGWDLVANQKL